MYWVREPVSEDSAQDINNTGIDKLYKHVGRIKGHLKNAAALSLTHTHTTTTTTTLVA